MNTDKLWAVISGIEYQLNILKDKLKNLDEETKQSVDEAYQRGLDDGKAVNDKGCDGCKYAGKVVTGPPCISCCNSYKNKWTANKLDEIEVGDEMRQVYESGVETGVRCIVTAIDSDCMSGFSQDGRAIVCSSQVNRWWKKTGRRFDIDKILKEMRK